MRAHLAQGARLATVTLIVAAAVIGYARAAHDAGGALHPVSVTDPLSQLQLEEGMAEATLVDDALVDEAVKTEKLVRCRECHLTNPEELSQQSRMARKKHKRVFEDGKWCSSCHEDDEIRAISMHAEYVLR